MIARECAYCGMPLEVISLWLRKVKIARAAGVETTETEMATARCLNDHWYGGPAADVTEEES